MDNDFKKELKRYKRKVRSLLLCGTRHAKQFHGDFSNNVDAFVEEQGAADVAAVKKQFGEPEEIARAFFESADIDDIRKKLRLRYIILFSLLAALLMWGIMLGIVIIENHKTINGHGEEVIYEIVDPDHTSYPGEIIIEGETAP